MVTRQPRDSLPRIHRLDKAVVQGPYQARRPLLNRCAFLNHQMKMERIGRKRSL